MGFEHGSVSFRCFQSPRPFPEDVIDLFAGEAAPGMTSAEAQFSGWVSSRHLLDRHITEETVRCGSLLRLTLLQAERKIPSSLLKTECTIEELALKAAESLDYVNARRRREIKEQVTERLLPNMPLQLKGIDVVYNPASQMLYAEAMTVPQSDLLMARLLAVLDFHVYPCLPDMLFKDITGQDPAELPAVTFSPQLDLQESGALVGQEFLTWLMYRAEKKGGTVVSNKQGGTFHFMLEGPLTFTHEGSGAHTTVLKGGEPVGSAETKTCLMSGKLLKQAKIILQQGEERWSMTLNAQDLSFRSVKLPDTDKDFDPVSRFEQRIQLLETCEQVITELFEEYARLRTGPGFSAEMSALHNWVKDRRVRF